MIQITLAILMMGIIYWGESAEAMSFNQAKTFHRRDIYGHKNRTFYCDCAYQARSIQLKSCEIKTQKFRERKNRLEWEHIVPAWAFGQSFKAWRKHRQICKNKSPRKCARKKSDLFKSMEGDPYNLVPAVGSVNAVRRHYSFAELSSGDLLCKRGLMLSGRKVMPPHHRKGDVARIYQYMHQKYPGRGIISKKNKNLFDAWDQQDPVDNEECQRYLRIKKITSLENEILKKRCQP